MTFLDSGPSPGRARSHASRRPTRRAGASWPSEPLERSPGMREAQTEFAGFYADTRDDCLRVVLASVGDPVLAEELVAEA